MDQERIQLIIDLAGSGKNVKEVREELERLDVATKTAGKSTADFGRTAIEGSRILQDFAQGGLGGIINNLEGFSRAIGLGAGAAGAATALGVAVLALKGPVMDLFRALTDGANDVPKSTDALKNLNDALETNAKRLGELKDKQSLTNAELAEYNRLTAESTRLEREANAEKERRNELERARKEEAAGSPESADIVKAATGQQGGVDATLNQIEQAMRREGAAGGALGQLRDQLRKALATLGAQQAKDPFDLVGVQGLQQKAADDLRGRVNQEEARLRTGAEDLLVRARRGDADAIREIQRLIPGGAFGQATPEAIKAQDAGVDAAQAEGEALHGAGEKRRKEEREKKQTDKLGRQIAEKAVRDQKAARERVEAEQNKKDETVGRAADREQREGSRKFFANPDYSPDKLRDIDAGMSPLGREFRGRSQSEGVNPTTRQIAEAVRAIQERVGHGVDKDSAMIQAFQQMIQNQNRLSGMLSQQQAQWRQAYQAARKAGSRMSDFR